MDNEFAAYVAIDWADQSTPGPWKCPTAPAEHPAVWIIPPKLWTSGRPNSGYVFQAGWWQWLWNHLGERWCSC